MQKQQRINNQIRAPRVHLIDSESINQGTVPLNVALNEARRVGLDLVEIALKDGLPLCKILDYGKFKYEQAKNKKAQPKAVVKELKLTPRIDRHDIEIKLKQVRKWIDEGHKVMVAVRFKGRENTYKELGYDVLNNFKIDGAHIEGPKSEGNTISMTLVRKAA